MNGNGNHPTATLAPSSAAPGDPGGQGQPPALLAQGLDIGTFALCAGDRIEDVEADIEKFVAIAARGIDMMRLGGFLAGVSILKAEAMLPKARRGPGGTDADRAKRAEAGILAWRRTRFPRIHNNSIRNWRNFALSIFATAKDRGMGDLCGDPLAFRVPASPDAMARLLEAVNAACDGKTLREIYAANGRAVPAMVGGARVKPDGWRRRTFAEKEFDDAKAKALEWYKLGFFTVLWSFQHPRDTWLDLPDTELANFADLLKRLSREVDEVCRSRRVVPCKQADWQERVGAATENAEEAL